MCALLLRLLQMACCKLILIKVFNPHNALAKLPAGQRHSGGLGEVRRGELDVGLAHGRRRPEAGVPRPGDHHPQHLAVLGGLVTHVLQDVAVLAGVPQVPGAHHVQQHQHARGRHRRRQRALGRGGGGRGGAAGAGPAAGQRRLQRAGHREAPAAGPGPGRAPHHPGQQHHRRRRGQQPRRRRRVGLGHVSVGHGAAALGLVRGHLHRERLVPKGHAVQPGAGLHRDRGLLVLAEAVALGGGGPGLAHQVEGLQRPEGRQQLAHLLVGEVVGQAADEDLVGPVLHLAGDDAQRAQVQLREGAPAAHTGGAHRGHAQG
mmetsp:Transcript_28370/g.46949  ORF Transcript_28370/g.46949 Transcript_28370/m.46949 type:complete len:317 (-) Transcript_28370:577-1527(-)